MRRAEAEARHEVRELLTDSGRPVHYEMPLPLICEDLTGPTVKELAARCSVLAEAAHLYQAGMTQNFRQVGSTNQQSLGSRIEDEILGHCWIEILKRCRDFTRELTSRIPGAGPLPNIPFAASGVAIGELAGIWVELGWSATIGITDITALAREIHNLVTAGNLAAAKKKPPAEQPYPLPDSLKTVIGAG